MKRAILLVLWMLTAATARAGGINLSWNDCGNSGALNESFACNTNTGSHTLVASFEPDVAMPDMIGNVLILDVQNTMPIPPWWQLFNSGSCRQTALTANVNFGANTSCVDFWSSRVSAGGIGAYQIGFSAPNRVRMIAVFAVQTIESAAVAPANQYYAAKIVISNAKTVGASSCFGCTSPGCIVLASIELDGDASPMQMITMPLDRTIVTWQGSVAGGCLAVPVMRTSWGQIKSLYR